MSAITAAQTSAPNATTVTINTAPAAPIPAVPQVIVEQHPVEQPLIQATGSSLNIYGFQLDWMVVALIVILATIVIYLYRAQRDPANQFDLLDLFVENNKLSRSACVMMGAFSVTSWMLINLTLNGKMTEGYFGLYSAAWIAPTVTRMIVGPAPQQKTELSVVSTTTSPEPAVQPQPKQPQPNLGPYG